MSARRLGLAPPLLVVQRDDDDPSPFRNPQGVHTDPLTPPKADRSPVFRLSPAQKSPVSSTRPSPITRTCTDPSLLCQPATSPSACRPNLLHGPRYTYLSTSPGRPIGPGSETLSPQHVASPLVRVRSEPSGLMYSPKSPWHNLTSQSPQSPHVQFNDSHLDIRRISTLSARQEHLGMPIRSPRAVPHPYSSRPKASSTTYLVSPTFSLTANDLHDAFSSYRFGESPTSPQLCHSDVSCSDIPDAPSYVSSPMALMHCGSSDSASHSFAWSPTAAWAESSPVAPVSRRRATLAGLSPYDMLR
mmetsp:Transcript_73835/g.130182  ORF Transcript_73835/g.130182 Transcript_73835/m.130182 type:complete len:302 (-) Transcript_73835:1210-2115(-)